MKKRIHLFIFISFVLLTTTTLQAQITSKTNLRDLPVSLDVSIAKSFEVPSDTTSVLLDNGKGKVCSCQFFTDKSTQVKFFDKSLELTLKDITVKGLFDGSQMHVARVYFNETDSYFKFKCYARDIKVEHVLEFLTFGSNIVANEPKE